MARNLNVTLCISACVFTLALCLSVLLIGYEKPWNWNVEGRLRRARVDVASQVRQYQIGRSPHESDVFQEIGLARILAGLCIQTAATLKSPLLCDVRFFQDFDSKNAMLVVYWAEEFPTADAVRILWEDGRTRDLPILEEQLEANRKVAQHSVLYDASFAFAHGSPEEREFGANVAFSVVLVKAGSEISDRSAVRRR